MSDLAKGFYFERPNEGAPEFVKGKLSIKVAEAIELLKAKQNNAGYVNLDLLQSKDKTKLYLVVNDWKPPVKEEAKPEPTFTPNTMPDEYNDARNADVPDQPW